jgi:predicted Zn-dependent peptidase
LHTNTLDTQNERLSSQIKDLGDSPEDSQAKTSKEASLARIAVLQNDLKAAYEELVQRFSSTYDDFDRVSIEEEVSTKTNTSTQLRDISSSVETLGATAAENHVSWRPKGQPSVNG